MTRRIRTLTLRDVSEAAGVSEMTVSRVLRGRGDVSERTRAKVQEAARKLGYVPNRIAGSLASQRASLVAVIIPSMSNMVFPDVMSGVSATLEGTGLQPVVGVTGYCPEKEEKALYEMLSWRPAGVVVAGLEHSQASRSMLAGAGVPVVEIMDVDGDPVDSAVGISHGAAGRRMAEAVVAGGYRKVAFLGTKMAEDHRARKRFEGFAAALEKAGIALSDRELYSGGSDISKGREMTRDVLDRTPDLDFICYSNDLIGAGGMLHLLEIGADIPNGVGLAGFNRFDLIRGLPRELATMDSCRFEIGQKAAEIVVTAVERESRGEPVLIELEPKISLGDTMRG